MRPSIDEYQRGALTALSILICCHDKPRMAADVLIEMGLSRINVADLDDWDKNILRKVQGERGGAVKLRGLGRAMK
jgi:hypothetical protein